MRLAAIILSLAGTVAAAIVGGMLHYATRHLSQSPEFGMTLATLRLEDVPADIRARLQTAFAHFFALPCFLHAATFLGVLGTIAAACWRGKLAGALMSLAVVGPLVLAISYAVFVFEGTIHRTQIERLRDEDAALFLIFLVSIPAILLGAAAICSFCLRPGLLRMRCPRCRKVHVAHDPLMLGHRVKCEGCGDAILLPTLPSAPPGRTGAILVGAVVLCYLVVLAAVHAGFADKVLLDLTPK